MDTKKTTKKKDGRGVNSTKRKRLAVESDSDTTAESEAHEEKPAPKKEIGDGGKSLQPKRAKEEEKRKGERTTTTAISKKMRVPTKIQKKRRAQTKHVTMAHHMQMNRPHPKKTHPPPRCDTVVFTRLPCYVACATSVQPLCNFCKHSLSRSCTHLHTGCTFHLRRTWRGNGRRRLRTSVRRCARSLAFRPVVVCDCACWKGRMVATVSASVAKANLDKVTRTRRKAKSWSESHCNGKMMRRWRQTLCGAYALSQETPHLQTKTTLCKQ